MTDRARSSTGPRAFADALERIGARHESTRGYRPQTDGEAEAFVRAMLREWAYVRLYRSNEERLRALPRWVDRSDRSRPHTASGGRPPMSAL
ncbi:MAG TPA: integrase core domain-containing protein, partial [Actinomycetota bacterium]|nr:integrase core domain-containing protein [Actinomycetota bacterium]